MKLFIGVVHKNEGSAYGVHFPDVPGCFSAADDIDDVVPNAAQALSLWFDDIPDKQPQSLETIRSAVMEEIANGAFLVAVPLEK